MKLAALVEKLLRPITFHPIFQDLEVLRLGVQVCDWYLVSAPRTLNRLAIHEFRARPALRGAQNDHRPYATIPGFIGASILLNPPDLRDYGFQCGRHKLVHGLGLMSFDEVGFVSVSIKKLGEFIVAQASEHSGVRDLVPVQMQNRKYCAIPCGVEKFVGMPARSQRTGLCFAIADNAAGQQVRIVKHGSVRMSEGVTEFSALVD